MRFGYFKQYPRYAYGFAFEWVFLLNRIERGWSFTIYHGSKLTEWRNFPFLDI